LLVTQFDTALRMKLFYFFIFVAVILIGDVLCTGERPKVRCHNFLPRLFLICRLQVHVKDQGDVLGEIWTSHSRERDFRAFTTIPYAAPPVGNLRFRPPRDPVPWEGVLDTAEANTTVCAQMNFFEVTIKLRRTKNCFSI
jgi:hypothetical protein